jgi:hypothetical protein
MILVFIKHLQKLIMRRPKAFVGAQGESTLARRLPSRQCGAGYANAQRARKGKGIAPLNHFWRCLLNSL